LRHQRDLPPASGESLGSAMRLYEMQTQQIHRIDVQRSLM